MATALISGEEMMSSNETVVLISGYFSDFLFKVSSEGSEMYFRTPSSWKTLARFFPQYPAPTSARLILASKRPPVCSVALQRLSIYYTKNSNNVKKQYVRMPCWSV